MAQQSRWANIHQRLEGRLADFKRTLGSPPAMIQDARLQQLNLWLTEQAPGLFARLGWAPPPAVELTPASTDASFRRYFRWQVGEHSLVVMDAPPPQEDCAPFVAIAGLLQQAGVNVPQIHLADLAQGFLAMSDLGRQTYLQVIDEHNADALFERALSALLQLQKKAPGQGLPPYDEALLRRELQLFPEWYVQRHLGLGLTPRQERLWQESCDLLVASALAQPRVLVHRDYMPRNLMLSEPNPGVLDFQDAVFGPVTYDVTCLFKDAFVSWPAQRVMGWLESYWRQALDLGLPVPADFQDFLRFSDLMGVQRHLKVIGIFSRICHRDGKPHYLADVPRFLAYIREVLDRRPELAGLGELLDTLPQAREQAV